MSMGQERLPAVWSGPLQRPLRLIKPGEALGRGEARRLSDSILHAWDTQPLVPYFLHL